MMSYIHFDALPCVEEQPLLDEVVLLAYPKHICPGVLNNDLPSLRRLALSRETLLQRTQDQTDLHLPLLVVRQQKDTADPGEVDLVILSESLLTTHGYFF